MASGFTGEAIVNAALAVFHSPGTYVALTGSGISREAGIPTGQQVMDQLIRTYAKRNGADAGSDPPEWWRGNIGEAIYGEVMRRLARTTAERQALLKPFFEPTPEEREQGLKMPTEAHRAIARLSRDGYIRVIVTTNQERLHETALVDEGVVPSVIYHPDLIRGAEPLDKARCTVIKVSGDYLDTRLLNTQGELSVYAPAMKRLLQRVFDEYGAVVCGWSADWDIALREVLMRGATRRYSWFWLVHTTASPLSQDVIQRRDAQVISGVSADALWTGIEQHVLDLASARAQSPVSPALALAQAKRLLRAPGTNRIELRELLTHLCDGVVAEIRSQTNQPYGLRDEPDFDDRFYRDRLSRLETALEAVLPIVAIIGTFGAGDQELPLLQMCFAQLTPPANVDGDPVLVGLLGYPALLCLYTAGIAMMAAGRHTALRDLLTVRVRAVGGQPEPLWVRLHPTTVLRGSPAARLDRSVNNWGANLYLAQRLRRLLKTWIPVEEQLAELLEQFDALIALLQWDGARGKRPHVGMFFFKIGQDGTPVERLFAQLLDESDPLSQALANPGLLQSRSYLESNLLKAYREWVNEFRPRIYLGDFATWVTLFGAG